MKHSGGSMGGPMTWSGVRADIERDKKRKAAYKGNGCWRCNDTGLEPAPSSYGEWGCVVPCTCRIGRSHDAMFYTGLGLSGCGG
uniref:Uncharacterized protein n=1 Tax=viral metagenome TaxID=1070528 RepID=A0A6M3IL81_9ZZZZ